jgi:uncharacterized protein (TIGR03086 family)
VTFARPREYLAPDAGTLGSAPDEEKVMSEISDRYRRLSDAFADKIANVPDDKWSAQSPCPDWTARDIVQHVIDTQGMFLGFIGKELGAIPPVADDPGAAWDAARAETQHALDDPALAGAEFDGFFGRTRYEEAVDRFLCFDLVVHGWDLAHATGLDETIAPEDVAQVREKAESFGDAMRSPQAFGPEVDPPSGADDQTRLLAFLGRRA